MKVRCKVCSNVLGNICEVKHIGIALNKPRRCSDFNYDLSKVKPTSKMEATYIPYHLSNRKAYKKYVAEEVVRQQEAARQNAAVNGVTMSSPDCLARYRATQEVV